MNNFNGSGFGKRKKKTRSAGILNEMNFLENVLLKASNNEAAIRQINDAISGLTVKNKELDQFIKFWQKFEHANSEIKKNAIK